MSESQKLFTFLAIFDTLNFNFCKISHLKMLKVTENSNFRDAQMVNKAVFGGFKMTKIDFT